jgi:large subunit ribosomal protein L22
MTKYKYTFKETENLAYAVGRDLSISPKHSIEICNAIRHQKISRAKAILKDAMDLNVAIPFRKFTFDLGHKAKIGPGRYPVNACKGILSVIESAEANAKFKNMDVETLYIAIAASQKASCPFRYGRHSRRKSKRAHIEIALKESKKVAKQDSTVKKDNAEKKAKAKPVASAKEE